MLLNRRKWEAVNTEVSPSDVNTTSHTTYATPNAYQLHTLDNPLPKGHYRHTSGVFQHPQGTEKALRKLQLAGFPMNQVAAVIQEAQSHFKLTSADFPDFPDGETAIASSFSGRMTSLIIISGTKPEIRHAEALLTSTEIGKEEEYHTL
ncbi:hypothetical protein [Lyngbya aestuarii]|uniref:hypothetical protein n=1 Tax=Lyngbya aestuarii TaxID=118322 RepID=UPI00403DFA32